MKYENKEAVDEICKEIDDLLQRKKRLADTHGMQVVFMRSYNSNTFFEHFTERTDDDFGLLAAKYRNDYLALIDIKLDAAHRKLADL